MIKVQADTISGVSQVEALSDAIESGSDILGSNDFYDSLRGLKDGETVYGIIHAEMAHKIHQEYGINFLQ